MSVIKSFTLIAVITMLAGAVGRSAEKEKPNGVIQEWKGFNAKQEKSSRAVIQDQKAWSKAWSAISGNVLPKQELPEVDFNKNSVIAVFMGRKMSGGYAVKVSSIESKGTQLIVTVQESRPPKGGFVTMALTSPYHVVVIPKSDKEVKFVSQKAGGRK